MRYGDGDCYSCANCNYGYCMVYDVMVLSEFDESATDHFKECEGDDYEPDDETF